MTDSEAPSPGVPLPDGPTADGHAEGPHPLHESLQEPQDRSLASSPASPSPQAASTPDPVTAASTTSPTQALRAQRRAAESDTGLAVLKDNLEAIAIAIVMALVIRHFCVEAFEIPTRSMEPTLWGAQDHEGIGDRILVDKSAYLFSGPARWDVIVFKYPLDRSRNFIKRLVGNAGETLRIGSDGGDVWIRSGSETAFAIARKPRRVRESLYLEVYPPAAESIPSEDARTDIEYGDGTTGLWAYWRTDERGRAAWDLSDHGRLRFLGGDQTALRSRNPITTMSSPQSWHRSANAAARVRDVRVQGTVTARPDAPKNTTADGNESTAELPLAATELRVRWQPDERFEYGFVLRSAEAGRSEAWIQRDGIDVGRRVLPVQFVPGKSVEFEIEAVDGDLRIHLDGSEVLVMPDERTIDDESSSNAQELIWEANGEPLDIADVRIDRDLVYGNSWSYSDNAQNGVSIPDDNFFMLGDNTGSSSDSRKWKIRTVKLKDGRKIQYDANGGDNNRIEREWDEARGGDKVTIRDVDGVTRFWFDDEEAGSAALKYAPFVHRDLIVGRAFLIFWPLFPDFPHRLQFIR